MFRTIVVALDGEGHTVRALTHAIDLARRDQATLVGLHVVDPYLKQFHNEIYAVGRQEYLDYVDRCLETIADGTIRDFQEVCRKEDVRGEPRVRHGDPIEEIVAASDGADLLVIGGKRLQGFSRWRSRNLPEKLPALVKVPLLIIRQ